jgi:hypothetical protein
MHINFHQRNSLGKFAPCTELKKGKQKPRTALSSAVGA